MMRVFANVTILVGFFLLGRVVCQAATGGMAAQFPALSSGLRAHGLYALGLSLPVPMHVIAVGLILQKKWLTHRWARLAWWAVVVSGCWLGTALLIKLTHLSPA